MLRRLIIFILGLSLVVDPTLTWAQGPSGRVSQPSLASPFLNQAFADVGTEHLFAISKTARIEIVKQAGRRIRAGEKSDGGRLKPDAVLHFFRDVGRTIEWQRFYEWAEEWHRARRESAETIGALSPPHRSPIDLGVTGPRQPLTPVDLEGVMKNLQMNPKNRKVLLSIAGALRDKLQEETRERRTVIMVVFAHDVIASLWRSQKKWAPQDFQKNLEMILGPVLHDSVPVQRSGWYLQDVAASIKKVHSLGNKLNLPMAITEAKMAQVQEALPANRTDAIEESEGTGAPEILPLWLPENVQVLLDSLRAQPGRPVTAAMVAQNLNGVEREQVEAELAKLAARASSGVLIAHPTSAEGIWYVWYPTEGDFPAESVDSRRLLAELYGSSLHEEAAKQAALRGFSGAADPVNEWSMRLWEELPEIFNHLIAHPEGLTLAQLSERVGTELLYVPEQKIEPILRWLRAEGYPVRQAGTRWFASGPALESRRELVAWPAQARAIWRLLNGHETLADAAWRIRLILRVYGHSLESVKDFSGKRRDIETLLVSWDTENNPLDKLSLIQQRIACRQLVWVGDFLSVDPAILLGRPTLFDEDTRMTRKETPIVLEYLRAHSNEYISIREIASHLAVMAHEGKLLRPSPLDVLISHLTEPIGNPFSSLHISADGGAYRYLEIPDRPSWLLALFGNTRSLHAASARIPSHMWTIMRERHLEPAIIADIANLMDSACSCCFPAENLYGLVSIDYRLTLLASDAKRALQLVEMLYGPLEAHAEDWTCLMGNPAKVRSFVWPEPQWRAWVDSQGDRSQPAVEKRIQILRLVYRWLYDIDDNETKKNFLEVLQDFPEGEDRGVLPIRSLDAYLQWLRQGSLSDRQLSLLVQIFAIVFNVQEGIIVSGYHPLLTPDRPAALGQPIAQGHSLYGPSLNDAIVKSLSTLKEPVSATELAVHLGPDRLLAGTLLPALHEMAAAGLIVETGNYYHKRYRLVTLRSRDRSHDHPSHGLATGT